MRIARMPLAEARPRAEELLQRVGLGERLHAPARHAVGRRAAARRGGARARHAAGVLLADEPTGDLDEQTADSLHALLREMHQAYGLTSVIATHNPRLAAACDRILRLEGGRLILADRCQNAFAPRRTWTSARLRNRRQMWGGNPKRWTGLKIARLRVGVGVRSMPYNVVISSMTPTASAFT